MIVPMVRQVLTMTSITATAPNEAICLHSSSTRRLTPPAHRPDQDVFASYRLFFPVTFFRAGRLVFGGLGEPDEEVFFFGVELVGAGFAVFFSEPGGLGAVSGFCGDAGDFVLSGPPVVSFFFGLMRF